MKPKLLFFASNSTFFEEMKKLILLLRDDFECHLIKDFKPKNLNDRKKKKTFIKKIKQFIKKTSFFSRFQKLKLAKDFGRKIELLEYQANALMNKQDWAAIISSGDRNVASLEFFCLKLAYERGIPSLFPPLVVPADKEAILEFRRGQYQYIVSKKEFEKYPEVVVWDNKSKNYICYYGSYQLDVLAKKNFISRNPWVIGSSYISKIMVSSQRTRDSLISSGCLSEKIIVTGGPSHDDLFQTLGKKNKLKADFVEKYNFDPIKFWVGIALPQYFEDGFMDWEGHSDEIQKIFDSLKILEGEINVLISLHPKMNVEHYQKLINFAGAKIIQEPLSQWISTLDIFLAHYSSTIEWAAALGIKAFILDYPHHNLPLYQGQPGIVVVKNKEEFFPLLKSALNPVVFNPNDYYAKVDGQALKRIKETIRKSLE